MKSIFSLLLGSSGNRIRVSRTQSDYAATTPKNLKFNNAPSGNRNRGTSLEGKYVTTTPKVPWRTWASIPLLLACKASALPFELVPRSLCTRFELVRAKAHQISSLTR
jgi:hypothetical protein